MTPQTICRQSPSLLPSHLSPPSVSSGPFFYSTHIAPSKSDDPSKRTQSPSRLPSHQSTPLFPPANASNSIPPTSTPARSHGCPQSILISLPLLLTTSSSGSLVQYLVLGLFLVHRSRQFTGDHKQHAETRLQLLPSPRRPVENPA